MSTGRCWDFDLTIFRCFHIGELAMLTSKLKWTLTARAEGFDGVARQSARSVNEVAHDPKYKSKVGVRPLWFRAAENPAFDSNGCAVPSHRVHSRSPQTRSRTTLRDLEWRACQTRIPVTVRHQLQCPHPMAATVLHAHHHHRSCAQPGAFRAVPPSKHASASRREISRRGVQPLIRH